MSERVEFEGVPTGFYFIHQQAKNPSKDSQPEITSNTGALLVPKREANQIVSGLRNLDWLKQGINVTAHSDYMNSHLLIHVSSSAAVSISRWLSDQTYSMDTLDFPSNDHKSLHGQLTHTDSPIIWLPNMRVKSPKSISLGGKKDNATYKNVPTTSIPLAQPINLEQNKKFRYIELFAGIGGFRVALDAIGGQSVFASEIGDSARFTYVSNFGNEKLIFEDVYSATGEKVERDVLVGDITAIETLDIPDHEILTAGFPCQSFCKVGDRKALDDERGELFFEVVRVLKGKKPKAFILENVANLVTMEEGRVFRIIRTQLEDVGYKIRYEIIDASAYVPQTRKRVYIVGFLDPIHFNSFQFPHPPLEGSTSKSKTLRQILDSDPPPTALLLTNHQLKKLQSSYTYKKNPAWRIANVEGKARTLMSSYKSGFVMYSEFVPVPLPPFSVTNDDGNGDAKQRDGTADEEEEREFSEAIQDVESGNEERAAKRFKSIERTGSDTDFQHSEEDDSSLQQLRFYSPRECARIMGFPEAYRLDHIKSEGTLYHQLGNAVCPPVVEAIARKVAAALGF